jgi:hypothetical protein
MPPEARRSLHEAQREFARVLLAPSTTEASAALDVQVWAAHPPIAPAARLAAYRNNTWQFFRAALELTYPVVRRRVGDDYFGQLARGYRLAHPSRSGDLHWVGEAFPAWLAQTLGPTDYAWLADLARLEWACESAVTVRLDAPLPLAALRDVEPSSLDDTTLRLQPSLRLVASPWPVVSVWQANQQDAEARPVNLATGPEHAAVACLGDGVVVYRLEAGPFAVLEALARGEPFARAIAESAQAPDVLASALRWAFDEGLVVALNPSAPA